MSLITYTIDANKLEEATEVVSVQDANALSVQYDGDGTWGSTEIELQGTISGITWYAIMSGGATSNNTITGVLDVTAYAFVRAVVTATSAASMPVQVSFMSKMI